jgi:hypothetical protein
MHPPDSIISCLEKKVLILLKDCARSEKSVVSRVRINGWEEMAVDETISAFDAFEKVSGRSF